MINLPTLYTGDRSLNAAFRIAIGDIAGNILPWHGEPVLCAGLDYDSRWTRDAAINSWYAAAHLFPNVSENSLRSVLVEDRHGLRIGGQYWDAIIWVQGAWEHYLATGNRDFLKTAFSVTRNSILYFENTEYDSGDGLFRGGACFQDGIAGYPDMLADSPNSSCIAHWVDVHPNEKADTGEGLPCKALSTNCLYYQAYRLLTCMAAELGVEADSLWEERATTLKDAINHRFWDVEAGLYHYLVDVPDTLSRREGFGHAFALLFGIASAEQADSIFRNLYRSPHGIPCLWPSFERYGDPAGGDFSRHAGPIWPQVNTAWALACARYGRHDLAIEELTSLAQKACRDAQFTEIYHPITGEPYGGLQERDPTMQIVLWESCRRQTWCATGLIRMILSVVFGIQCTPKGMEVRPHLPMSWRRAVISGLRYRNAIVDLTITATESAEEASHAFVPAEASGHVTITLSVDGAEK